MVNGSEQGEYAREGAGRSSTNAVVHSFANPAKFGSAQ